LIVTVPVVVVAETPVTGTPIPIPSLPVTMLNKIPVGVTSAEAPATAP
jgi:hypothetical protein